MMVREAEPVTRVESEAESDVATDTTPHVTHARDADTALPRPSRTGPIIVLR